MPGLTAASNWIKPSSVGPPFAGVNVRSNPEMTPALIEPANLNGLPTANISSPTRIAPELPIVAGRNTLGCTAGGKTAISFSGCSAAMMADDWTPSAKFTSISVASSTMCSAVRIAALSLMMTPLPTPNLSPSSGLAVSTCMITKEGRIASYTSAETGDVGVADARISATVSVSNQQKWDTLGAERSGAGWRFGELPEGPVVASSPFGGLSLHLLPAL